MRDREAPGMAPRRIVAYPGSSDAGDAATTPEHQQQPAPTSNAELNENHAGHLKDSAASMFMFASMSTVLKDVDVTAYRLYRDRLLADYGNPQDPIVVMMVEQLAMAHLNLGLLYHKAAVSGSSECSSAYLAAAARLMAEFRRSALALPVYREAARRVEHWADGQHTACAETYSYNSKLGQDGHDAPGEIEDGGFDGRGEILPRRQARKAAAGGS